MHSTIEKVNFDDVSLAIYQAKWYVRGLIYHCRNLAERYANVIHGVSVRVQSTNADVVVMYTPDVQKMMFEFYALVNLARISLDNLRNVLHPVFKTQYGQLPKSISDFILDSTDCPVYVMLAKQPIVKYLSDIRNCIVHYRSFATNDNAVACSENFEKHESEEKEILLGSKFASSMAQVSFRRIEDDKIVVNIFLPDRIFEPQKKLCDFTYKERINILSQSREFLKLVWIATLQSFTLLINPGLPTYTYKKAKKI